MHDALNLSLALLGLGLLSFVWRRFARPDGPPGVFWRFWQHTVEACWGRRFVWFGLSVAATLLLVLTEWDRQLQDVFQRGNLVPREWLWALLVGGTFWTLIVALGLLAAGWITRRRAVRLAGSAATQAVLVAFVITHVLKALTGRRGPLDPSDPYRAPFPKSESAMDFAFDLWNRSVGDGRFFWPSGHTMSSMVLVTALCTCFPHKRWIAWTGYPLVALMAVGMIDGDFHWTSDVIAGLLLGWATGSVVGRAMRAEDGRRSATGSTQYVRHVLPDRP